MLRFYQQLTYEQRCQIEILKERGDSPSQIARILNRDRSTITRELKRNGRKKGSYLSKEANAKARKRRRRSPWKMTQSLIDMIEKKLQIDWSPEQISGRLKREGICKVSPETIYRHIRNDRKRGGCLYKHLRHKGKKYNKPKKGSAGRGCIPNRVDIDERPTIVDKKVRIGDWEGDTIIGACHDGVIVSMVERYSKYTKAAKANNKTSKEVNAGIKRILGPIAECVLTCTLDNGKEFSGHQELAEALKADFYFAKPYHSWERGLNEHTNGLLRQYLPKGMRLSEVTQEDLDKLEVLLNHRPRKSLDFQTPAEVFEKHTL